MIDIGPRRELELPKSGLYVADGALCRETSKHQRIGSHPLANIESAALVRRIDWSGVILTAGLTALGVVAKIYLPPGWDWAVGIVLIAVAGLCALGIWSLRLELRCHTGNVTYELSEMRPDCEGFIVSLNDVLARQRAQPAQPQQTQEPQQPLQAEQPAT